VSTETYATPTSGGATSVGTGSPKRTVKAPPRPRRETSSPPAPYIAAARPATRAQTSPEPRLRQLVGVCVWAAVIGGVALITGIRAIIGSIGTNPPSWYQPWVIAVGLGGLALTVAAFVTVNRRWAPFALLGAASVLVIVAINLTAHAF
jgi:hypothetical protein